MECIISSAQVETLISVSKATVKQSVQIPINRIDNAKLTLNFEKEADQFKGSKANFNYINGDDSFDTPITIDIFNKTKVSIENDYRRLLRKLKPKDDICLVNFKVDGVVKFQLEIGFNDFRQMDNCNIDLEFLQNVGCSDDLLSYKNLFGEDASNFPKNKVVYILDFEPNLNSYQFYKIYKTKPKKIGKFESQLNSLESKDDEEKVIITIPSMGKETLKATENVQFKIHNINRFRYNAAISSTHVQFDSESSPLFNEYFIGDINGLLGNLIEEAEPSGAIEGRSGMESLTEDKKKETQKVLDGLAKLAERVKCLNEDLRKFNDYFYRIYMQCQRFPCCNDVASNNAILMLGEKLGGIKALLNGLLLPIRQKNKRLEELEKTCNEHEKLKNEINQLVKKEESLKNEVTKLKSEGKDTKEKEQELKQEQEKRKKKEAALSKMKCDKDQIKKLKKEVKPFAQLMHIESKLPSESDFKRIALQFNSINAYANQYVKTIPQLRGSRLDLGFYIQEKDTVRNIDGSVTDPTIDSRFLNRIDSISIPVIKRWLISFSSGPFVGHGDRISPPRYIYQPLPSGSTVISSTPSLYRIVESGRDEEPLGISGLINLQYQTKRAFGLGLSAGVGLSIEDNPKPAYLGGGSIMLGQRRQIVITAGLMITKVGEFNNSLLGGNITYEDTSQPIEYNNVIRSGGFFSITYTPFNEIKL